MNIKGIKTAIQELEKQIELHLKELNKIDSKIKENNEKMPRKVYKPNPFFNRSSNFGTNWN